MFATPKFGWGSSPKSKLANETLLHKTFRDDYFSVPLNFVNTLYKQYKNNHI